MCYIFVAELANLVKNSIPISSGLVLLQLMGMAPIFSLGHLGTRYLAAIALTTMFCNITGFSVILGMASSLDTLASQSFTASEDKHAVGRHLQRVLFVEFLLCVPIIFIWCHSAPILVFFGQDKEIAELTNVFTSLMSFGLVPYALQVCVQKFLQAQGIMHAQFSILLFVVPVSFLLQYLFVFSLEFGAVGGPIATATSFTFVAALLLPFAAFVNGYQCWGGIEIDEILNLNQLRIVCSLGLPGIVMVCRYSNI